MSSVATSGRRHNCDSHGKKKYSRRTILFTDECGQVNQGPTVPVYENIGGHENDGHQSTRPGDGQQAGDSHIVGRYSNVNSPQRREKSPAFHCGICKESPNEPTTSTCGHIFCRNCVEDQLRERPGCPVCSSSFENKIYLKVPHQCHVKSTKTKTDPKIPARPGIFQLGFDKSAEYLSKLKEFIAPANLKEKASSLLKIEYLIIIVLSVFSLLLLLIVYGFIPKIRLWDFFCDLKDFIANYNFIDASIPVHPNPDHTTIMEDKLPGTVGVDSLPGVESTNCSKCTCCKSIFENFLIFLGLVR